MAFGVRFQDVDARTRSTLNFMARRPRRRPPHTCSLQPVLRYHVHRDFDTEIGCNFLDPNELGSFTQIRGIVEEGAACDAGHHAMGVGICACWALIFWHLNALNDHPSSVAIPLGFRVDLAPIKPWSVVVGQHLFG